MSVISILAVLVYTALCVTVSVAGVDCLGFCRKTYVRRAMLGVMAFGGWIMLSILLAHDCWYGAVQFALDHLIAFDDSEAMAEVCAATGIACVGGIYALALGFTMAYLRTWRHEDVSGAIARNRKFVAKRDDAAYEKGLADGAVANTIETAFWDRKACGPLKEVSGAIIGERGRRTPLDPAILQNREGLKAVVESFLGRDTEDDASTTVKTEQQEHFMLELTFEYEPVDGAATASAPGTPAASEQQTA